MVVLGSPLPSLAPYPATSVSELLAVSARQRPRHPALIDADTGKSWTYADIWSAASRLARVLQDDGLTPGDRVALQAANSPEWAVAFHAALLAGAAVTTLNPLYREREVAHQLGDAEPTALFADGGCWELAADVWDDRGAQRPYRVEDVWSLADAAPGDHGAVATTGDSLAALPYSSGTTGAPKGVMLSHANLAANVRQFLGTGLADAFSVFVDVLPFFHIYGMTVLLNAGLAAGATQVVMRGFDPQRYLDLVARYRATNLFLVPPALLALAEAGNEGGHDTASVRFIVSGAAPLPLELARRVQDGYGIQVLQGYGMTEASPVTHVSILGRNKPGTIGPPVPDTFQRVVDDDGNPLGIDAVGEMHVAGPQVMVGYWHNAAATAEAIVVEHAVGDPDGLERRWLRTGDLVSMDSDAYVTIHDRAKEMIKYRGYQIAPAELESVLLEHPAVADAAVIPTARGAGTGEVPKAVVVLRDGAATPTAEQLMAFVADRVAPYKKVREVEVVAAIPRSASGKILRRELIARDRAAAAVTT